MDNKKMFQIFLKVSLVTPVPSGKLLDHEPAFREAIDNMNKKEANYNQKHVRIVKVKDNEIIISVESELELAIPGRAFTGLSRYLIKNSDDGFFRENVFHNKLLKFQMIDGEDDNIIMISEEQILYRLAFLVLKPMKDLSGDERTMLKQLKTIAKQIKTKER